MFEDLRSFVAYLKQKGEAVLVEGVAFVRHDMAAAIQVVVERTGTVSC